MKNKCHAFKSALCLLSWRKRTELKMDSLFSATTITTKRVLQGEVTFLKEVSMPFLLLSLIACNSVKVRV